MKRFRYGDRGDGTVLHVPEDWVEVGAEGCPRVPRYALAHIKPGDYVKDMVLTGGNREALSVLLMIEDPVLGQIEEAAVT